MPSFQENISNAITLSPWSTQYGQITFSYQPAWYRIDLHGDERLTLDLTSDSSDFDGQLAIYDAWGNLLASDDDSGQGTDAWLQFSPTSTGQASYYLMVSGYQADTGQYQLHTSLQWLPPGETLTGSEYSDTLYDPTPGNDLLQGLDGDDYLTAGVGSDTLDGGNGNDFLDALEGGKLLLGGEGSDSLHVYDHAASYSGSGGSTLDGGAGDDWLFTHTGNSTLTGGTGNDQFHGRWHGNTYLFNAGDGHDVIDLSEPGSYEEASASLYDPFDTKAPAVIQFGAGITADNLMLMRGYFNDLHLEILSEDGPASITLQGWFRSDTPQALDLLFADGSRLDSQTLWEMTFGMRLDGAQPLDSQMPPLTASSYSGESQWFSIAAIPEQPLQFSLEPTWSGYASLMYLYDASGHLLAQTASDGLQPSVLTWTASEPQQLYLVVATADWGQLDFTLTTSSLAGQLLAGSEFDDVLEGSIGNDSLEGQDGWDMLGGGAGNDSLSGGAGNDLLDGGEGNDLLDGGEGSDAYWLERGFGQDTLVASPLPEEQEFIEFGPGITRNDLRLERYWPDGDTTQPGQLSIALAGGLNRLVLEGDETLLDRLTLKFADGSWMDGWQLRELVLTSHGSELPDILYSGSHPDDLRGGAGDDQLFDQNYSYAPWLDNDTLDGGDGNDSLLGGTGDDLLKGGAGDDWIGNHAGHDTLDGGAGDDWLESWGWGDELLLGGAGNDSLKGGDGNDSLDGGSDNDWLEGGMGLDSYWLRPGGGEDRVLDWDGAIVLIDPSLGPDDIELQLYYHGADPEPWLAVAIAGSNDRLIFEDMPAGEILPISVQFADGTLWDEWQLSEITRIGTGTVLDDMLHASNANDSIDAGDGNDLLDGGAGNDTLDGGDGADKLLGQDGDDLMLGGHGDDALYGGNGVDTLQGGEGNDYLNGNGGSDLMVGGLGDDSYVVSGAGDQVVELAGEGLDLVMAFTHYSLSEHVENLSLRGSLALNGSGNELDNRIEGNDADNLLSGLEGADRLYGNAGNDTLDGGTGDDLMAGGRGNDLYVIDSAGDQVEEQSNAGIDSVLASVGHTLASGVENLTLTGSALLGNGNALDNQLDGNTLDNQLSGLDGNDSLYGHDGSDLLNGDDGSDWLDGGEGNDTLFGGGNGDSLYGAAGDDYLNGNAGSDLMAGGQGNDFYVVSDSDDQVLEAADEGLDTVQAFADFTLGANVENLSLGGSLGLQASGNALDNLLTGNGAANVLSGLGGNDTLQGGGGADTLSGGNGDDVFRYTSVSNSGAQAGSMDVILDFEQGHDLIDLSGVDANSVLKWKQHFTTLLDGGDSFTAAGQLKFVDGVLYGNTDADADAEFAIALTGVTSLSNADFIL